MGGCALHGVAPSLCVSATQCGRVAFFPLYCFFFYSWRLHINFVYSVRARVLMAEPLLGIGETVCVCASLLLGELRHTHTHTERRISMYFYSRDAFICGFDSLAA